jgi:hypothetical protein
MEDCAICFETLDNNIINKWSCNHKFHSNCIKVWNKYCPFCRTTKLNNQNINLTPNITYLIFFEGFNQKVNNLPPNITHLTFGSKFNQEVNNLPPNITHLTFGYYFNQEVNNLPPNITHLTFGYYFNQ